MAVCPPNHKHAITGTCWTHHKCRCKECRTRENARVKSDYQYKVRVKGLNYVMDSHGVRRRLQAVAVMGWSTSAIGRWMNKNAGTVAQLRDPATTNVTKNTHEQVDRMFRELGGRLNPDGSHIRRKALAAGWVSALAWDDIDNPDEVPQGVGRSRSRGVDEELVTWLWRDGLSDPEIAERMGCSWRQVAYVRQRLCLESKWVP